MPTYMEKDNLPSVLEKVLSSVPAQVLVIDDNSPDGTAQFVEGLMKTEPRVHLMKRPGKMGLGTAYIAGFKWGLANGFDCMVEMDSDFSHNPADLPRLIGEIEAGADLVIGSRYIGGTISVVGWDFKRLLLSKFGNIYASTLLGMDASDITSGYRAFSRRALESVNLDAVHSEGYSFQIEIAYLIWSSGLKLKEVPIIFTERASGVSKMSKTIIREAALLPWRIRFTRFKARLKGAPQNRALEAKRRPE
ncbi:MAG: polyprenol monophosphomannose synthase [Nitrospiraceae bacterium]|nr:polyprenol monophosphomannose synthase [Nitrospiraceae bacterium]